MFQAQTGSGGGITVLVLQMAAIGLVFYFLILRPSGQARKKHAELLGACCRCTCWARRSCASGARK